VKQRPSALPRRRALRAAASALLVATAAAAGMAGRAAAADLPSVIATVKPSVLPVGTYSATGNPRFEFRGTGFAVGDGTLVATNFHVLPDGAEVESGPQMAVMAPRGSSGDAPVRRARVVATDRLRDLVLLQIEGPPLTPLTLAETGAAREGQGIALLGFPIGGTLGFSVVTHRGIIASLTTAALPAPTARQLDPRAVSRLREGNFEVLQLDATAYPGNSGGPVIDAESGVVLGVVNQVLVKSSRESALASPTGITYAIPVALLRDLLRELQRNRSETGKAP
jgi:S1-C subfamily serine protease